jgi:Major Facilitator Superfamily
VGPLPYATVVRDSRFGRLLPGLAVSYLGDGMSAIAVSWLALQIAPAGHGGRWVAVAAAAYTFPGAIGTFALARPLGGRPGAQLVGWNSTLRAASLGAIAVIEAANRMSIWSFVALLAVSSVLHAWGSAGAYTMVAELLPERDHLPANALLGMLVQAGVLIGPAIAGAVIAWRGAGSVLALDALTFAVLAVSCRLAVPPHPRSEPAAGAAEPGAPELAAPSTAAWSADGASSGSTGGGRASLPADAGSSRPVVGGRSRLSADGALSRLHGFRLLAADRRLVGLLALTFGFYTLYGPFEVGLPVYVADYQHAPASHLAWYFTAFGAGAVVGGLIAGHLRSWPLGPATSGIVIGVGAALLPLGLGAPDPIAVACYAMAGLIFAPYGSLTTALFQRTCDRSSIAQVLAARGTVMILSGPAGVGLGGLLVTGMGVRAAFLIASAGTLALGVLAAFASWSSRRR